ncbi:MAG TPA: glycine cleavage system protein H [Candidatus Lokiarchaeia archaeon]
MVIWYTKTHQWFDDESGNCGLTAYAAEQLGEISFVDLEALEGADVQQLKMSGDEPASDPLDCTIESSKAVGDIYSPVSGSIVAINRDLMDAPEKINEDPMGAWIFQIEASKLADEKKNLLNEKQYQAFIGQ